MASMAVRLLSSKLGDALAAWIQEEHLTVADLQAAAAAGAALWDRAFATVTPSQWATARAVGLGAARSMTRDDALLILERLERHPACRAHAAWLGTPRGFAYFEQALTVLRARLENPEAPGNPF